MPWDSVSMIWRAVCKSMIPPDEKLIDCMRVQLIRNATNEAQVDRHDGMPAAEHTKSHEKAVGHLAASGTGLAGLPRRHALRAGVVGHAGTRQPRQRQPHHLVAARGRARRCEI